MTKTLRWKKTIGVIAIVLGVLRFCSGYNALMRLSDIENIISSPYLDQAIAHDLQSYVDIAKIILPLNCFILCTIFILGIGLLCADKGLTDEMPRPKSYWLTVGILVTAIIHLILEVASFAVMPASLSDQISITTTILSLGFVLLLIIWCSVGLGGLPKDQRVLPTPEKSPYILTTGTDLTPQERAAIMNASRNQPEPLSPLDAEIEQLKKAIEKRKLEKEVAQINAEKQAEIEQLKQQLTELE